MGQKEEQTRDWGMHAFCWMWPASSKVYYCYGLFGYLSALTMLAGRQEEHPAYKH